MNKADLITKVAEEASLTKAQATAAVSAFTGAIEEALKAGDRVQLIGFGTFVAKNIDARECRNPKNGEKVKVDAYKKPVFIAGTALKNNIQ